MKQKEVEALSSWLFPISCAEAPGCVSLVIRENEFSSEEDFLNQVIQLTNNKRINIDFQEFRDSGINYINAIVS